ncbi:hypothetical protein G6O69_34390 [Pseudenhygromyxa sp. WMMC2535]|uniref:hypothetical protein n=1 Tax=Pseudenhygromyxa sp. WMMC2535 TaxID=2712867 RepID=UPI0015562E72|nr:hypothetical protein [Pseudenhygromyxa sp. WMMC2535]NVB42962.1 hypothetical protein [Pseudenhygromyxa sp. WMMC2535]
MDRNFASFKPRFCARATPLLVSGVLAAIIGLAPQAALAAPRDDMKAAYDKALSQANNDLDYEGALSTINNAITSAINAGLGDDPVLASLYMLRAALTFTAEGHAAKDRIIADLKGAVILNYYVVVPVEMRSDDLAKYMEQARQASGLSAPQPITLREVSPTCGEDMHFEVLLSVPDGGSAALYWRKQGDTGEFNGAEMAAFSNVAEVDVPASGHADANIEYFVYAFDASNNPVANLGLQDEPMVLEQNCNAEPVEADEPEVEEKPKEESSLPRFWVNIGFGTGFGVASGTAENTYRQFFPRGAQAYGAAEAGCAIARWVAGEKDVSTVDATKLLAAFQSFGAPDQIDAMVASYDATACAERHPVSTGMAIAPFHIEPEFSFRLGNRVSLGVFSRLQVVTGAKLYRDDASKSLSTAYTEDVRSINPQGVRQKVAFSWTAGIKFKYFLGKDEWKIRPFVGAFAGYGHARLRVDMGFANDRNGNSVPDDVEIASDVDSTGSGCFPVWPYNNACDSGNNEDATIAQSVAQNADSSNRIDVVKIGPVFAGAMFGFSYQIAKHFALFGELQIGGYFPDQSSVLFDLVVGPSITF